MLGVLVMLVSFSVLCGEMNLYHTLTYQFSYWHGLAAVGLTLAGLALGAFGAARRADAEAPVGLCLVLHGLLLFAVPFYLTLPLPAMLTMVGLVLPFVPAGFVLSRCFQSEAVARLYAADLIGAGIAAVVFPALLAGLRQEGLFLSLGSAGMILGALWVRPRAAGWGLLALALGASLWAAQCLSGDRFNFAARLSPHADFPEKIYNFVPGTRERRKIVVSRADVVQRIDVTPSVLGGYYDTWYDGYQVDIIRSNQGYAMDRRLGGGLGKTHPRILIIGTAGQGVLKPAKLLTPPDRILGLEINRAVVDVMKGPMREYSRDPYRHVPLVFLDGRTFLAAGGERFDVITMLNTHTVRNISQGAVPNYLHTREAIQAGLERLTDDGYWSIEERNPDGRSQAAIERFILTLLSALHGWGAPHPERHLAIYQWYGSEDTATARVRSDFFVQILVSRNPLGPQQVEFLRRYENEPREPPTESDHPFLGLPHIRLRYLPDGSLESPYADLVRRWTPAHVPITDDRPFLLGPRERAEIRPRVLFLGMVLALTGLPSAWLLRRWLGGAGLRATAVVSLAGFSYGLLQSILVGRLQLWLGTPGLSLAVVLGGMLVFSGLGSWCLASSQGRSRRFLGGALLGGYVTLWWLWGHGLALVSGLPQPLRIAVTLLALAPMATVTGYFFPWVSRQSGLRGAPRAPSALFGVASAGAAAAIPCGLWGSLELGMAGIFWLSLGGYGLALWLLGSRSVAARRSHFECSRSSTVKTSSASSITSSSLCPPCAPVTTAEPDQAPGRPSMP